jgi:glycerophosphoryl diester phosphodiesterase
LTLEQGLAHVAQDAWMDVELDVDLKTVGYERRVIEALRSFGLAERALISTMEQESLSVVRAAAPEIRLGWSVPKLRRNYLGNRFTRLPALAVAQYVRRVLPGRAARAIRDGRIDAVMSHWALVTPRLARTIEEAGGELYVWTVDDPTRIAALDAIGVTGIITNDPRLFLPAPVSALSRTTNARHAGGCRRWCRGRRWCPGERDRRRRCRRATRSARRRAAPSARRARGAGR